MGRSVGTEEWVHNGNGWLHTLNKRTAFGLSGQDLVRTYGKRSAKYGDLFFVFLLFCVDMFQVDGRGQG